MATIVPKIDSPQSNGESKTKELWEYRIHFWIFSDPTQTDSTLRIARACGIVRSLVRDIHTIENYASLWVIGRESRPSEEVIEVRVLGNNLQPSKACPLEQEVKTLVQREAHRACLVDSHLVTVPIL